MVGVFTLSAGFNGMPSILRFRDFFSILSGRKRSSLPHIKATVLTCLFVLSFNLLIC